MQNLISQKKRGNIVKQKHTMKVLGNMVNRMKNMNAHMFSLMAKLTNSYIKIKGAIPFMNKGNKKIILESKLKSQLSLTLPLMLNQSNRVQKRACAMMMKVNKWICGGPTFKVNSEIICKAIGTPLLEQELLNSNAKFIHKMIGNNICKSLHDHIAKPNRSTSIYYHRRPKKKFYRTSLEHHTDFYHQILRK